MAYSYLRLAVIRIALTLPLCTLSYIKVISGTGAVCHPVGTPLYLFGVKMCVCLASLGEGLPAQGQQERCQLAASARARRIWHRLHLLADVQPTSEPSAGAEIRKDSGLLPSRSLSAAKRNRVPVSL